MYNNGRSSNITNASNQEETQKITEKLRLFMYLLFLLAFLRIFSLQFYGLISDLIAGFIVYCTYISKGKIMAMFCLINAFMGIVYSIAIGSMDLAKLNKPQVVKGPNVNNNNGLQGMSNGNYNNNNYQFSNGVNNNNSNIPNKDVYGINDNNTKNDYGNNFSLNRNDNNLNSNQFGYNDIDKNNIDNLGNQDNNGNINTNNQSENRSFMFIYILAVTIYSVIVYCLLTYYSYKAFNTYKPPFGQMSEDAENPSGGYNNGQNYGALDTNRNNGYSSLGRSSTAAAPAANTNGNFQPFGGSGQRLAD